MVFIGRQFYKYQIKSEASVTDVYRTGRMMNTSICRSKGMLIPCQYSDKDNQPLFSAAAATGVTIGLLINPFNNQCGAVQQPFQGLVENTEANCSILLEAFSGETRGSSGSLAKKRESISKDERSNNGENGDESIDLSYNVRKSSSSRSTPVPETVEPETVTTVPVAAEPVPEGPSLSSTPLLKQESELPSLSDFQPSVATGSAPPSPVRTRKSSTAFSRFAFGRRSGFFGKSVSVSKLPVSTDAPPHSISTASHQTDVGTVEQKEPKPLKRGLSRRWTIRAPTFRRRELAVPSTSASVPETSGSTKAPSHPDLITKEQQASGKMVKRKASKRSFKMPKFFKKSSQVPFKAESHGAGSGTVKQKASGSMETSTDKGGSTRFAWFFRRRRSVMPGAKPEVTGAKSVVTETAPVVTETEPVVTETEPVVTETEPVVTETEPVVSETEPVVTGAAPASCEARAGSPVAKEAVAEGESTAGKRHTLGSGTRSRRGSATGPQEEE